MKRRIIIEEAVGETRAAVYEAKLLVELYARRWSDKSEPRAGDIFSGRITRIEKKMDAAFVDLGSISDGFLKFTNAQGAPHLTEGQYIQVLITREAEQNKGAILKFHAVANDKKIGPIKAKTLKEFLIDRFPDAKVDEAAVNAIEEAIAIEVAIPGGGDIAIESTRALTAVDVDKGYAVSGFDVSIAACDVIAREIRRRNLGGLFVIDFPNLRQARQREKLYDAICTSFETDPNTVKIAPVSRFGTVELTRAKTGRSLEELMLDSAGYPTVETQALRALRVLEREGRSSPGAKLVLSVPDVVFSWLKAKHIDWEQSISERLGARFEIAIGDEVDVSSDR